MKIIDKAIPSRKPKTKDSQIIIYFYVIILVVFVFCQLFTFDEFLGLIESFSIPGGLTSAHLIGGLIVVSEVLALPFLLRLSLSPLMRIISMVLGWVVPVMWLLLTIWVNLTVSSALNIGFLGTAVDLLPGWWATFVSLSLGVLAAWSSWSLWPFESNKVKKVKN